MNDTSLRDILIRARQESARMQHHYLGAEHLCIGMLHLPGGALAAALEAQGFTPAYLTDRIRRKVGKGAKQRLWAGLPHSPRSDILISIANDRALDSGRKEPDERDLALAMLDEADSLPVRVLAALGVDFERLTAALEDAHTPVGSGPVTEIQFADAMDADLPLPDLLLLRRMFRRSGHVRLERRLPGGHTSARVLLATPLQPDGGADATVVVKIDHADAILDETQRYETFVKHTLPPLTARLIDAPVVLAEENLAGLMYTFVPGESGQVTALDLESAVLGNWLRDELYPAFNDAWWGQRRPYRFPAWAEYDWLLPPLLTIEQIAEEEARVAFVVRDPVRRARIRALEYGTVVSIEDFVLEKVRPETGTLLLVGGKGHEAARRAFRIEVRKAGLEDNAYFRGEVVERIVGRVWRTRDESLMFSLLALDPDFDPRAVTIPGTSRDHRLPNPLAHYDDLLDRKVDGTLSTLHGDLHLGNILIGRKQAPFLIDFEQARSGHTLFDWASLETSLHTALVAPAFGQSWEAARRALGLITNLQPPLTAGPGDQVLYPVLAVREIVALNLAVPGAWAEYALALAFTALRGMGFADLSLGARRLLLLVAAQAMADAGAGSTPPPGAPADATQLDLSTSKQ
ncbi:MAG TPA: Clp protease N-terminal domain-containing protein [Candidatus Limnocylindrales bacterium]|nr:Clp protease N-terminal domain-containing protein [Candidatus Limnocylindrales bacterium]